MAGSSTTGAASDAAGLTSSGLPGSVTTPAEERAKRHQPHPPGGLAAAGACQVAEPAADVARGDVPGPGHVRVVLGEPVDELAHAAGVHLDALGRERALPVGLGEQPVPNPAVPLVVFGLRSVGHAG
jgi:hypothetical protein